MRSREYVLAFLLILLMLIIMACTALFMIWNFSYVTRSRTEVIQIFTPTPTPSLTPSPTPPLPSPTPSPTLTFTPSPLPTFTPTPRPTPTPTLPRYLFTLSSPVRPALERGCIVGSIFGYIKDASGNLLAGVRVKVFNPWGYEAVTISKGGPDQGYYDVILSTEPSIWYVVVIDEKGVEISPRVTIEHRADSPACHYQVDWIKTQ